MNSAEAANKPTRISRKKQKTKDKLLKAMQVLIMRQGLNSISINDITEEADVGLGTFYNYFDSKEALIEAVTEILCASYHQDVDDVTEGLEDPAEIMTASILYTLNKSIDGSNWGKMVFESGVPIESYALNLRFRGMNDIKHGIEKGRFTVDDPDVMLSMFTGFAMAVAGDVYFGALPKSAIKVAVSKILTLLGIDKEEAIALTEKEYTSVSPKEIPFSLFELRENNVDQA